ncbi:hypothetical protein HKI87_07g47870 [Chloropicon roscoffensis]|uniref:Uncharacterized protein n=1 Tax=Chloropicon roscoffensis TaxID=1461544 RepID=A0AAX4PAI6_9CHLO
MERVWDEWVRKEFVHTMRAKGKWEVPKTLASEAKRKELSGSMRIFCSEEDNPAMRAKPEKKQSKKRHPKERHAIKQRLLSVMKEMEEERQLTKDLTAEYRESLLQNLKDMNKELELEVSA